MNMGRSELAAQQRMQLEAILEEFEEALRNASEGNLPDVDTYLVGIVGDARAYLEREMRSLVRDVVRGNYVVLNPLESGGMGSVSRVRHLGLGKVMALKEIRPEALQIGDRDEVLRRFRREIELCGRLDEHPNVVSYTDTGVNDLGVPYLVMDFIDGEDLGKIVRRTGPLSIPDAAQVIHDAAIGLAHAHDHGLVHRDVKPSNVMISRYGVVKVLDFGLARIAIGDKSLTALTTGKVMGTFDYMSPELCREITPDQRGDVYSLGCTLYYALAGKAPFEDSKSQFEKMNAHLHVEPAPIPQLADHPELEAILQKMIAKQPGDRYPDLHQVAEALAPFCGGSNLRALAPSAKPRKPGQRAGVSRIRIDDAAGRATDSKAGDRTAAWTRARRRHERAWLTAVLVIGGVALFALLLAASAWRRDQHRRESARIIGTLPGLNGRWWFDEAPWLLPDVRQQMIDSLADADQATREQLFAAIGDNPGAPEAYEMLERVKERFKRRWPSDVVSHLANVEAFDPEDANPDEFAISLRQTANSLLSKPQESLTGAELHLRAVIHHYLQELEPANRMYEAAAVRYDREKQPELRALCFLDWGELLHGFRQPARAHSRYRLAYQALASDEPLPPLFEVFAKAMEADSHRRIDNTREAELLLQRAWEVAQTLPAEHPLRAMVLERRGWLNLDRWRLDEARDDFQQALAIRRAGEPDNHRARHFILWDLQGIAMVNMYAGDALAARRQFQELLDQINAAQGEMTKKQLSELEDRRPNLYERLADTALLTGSDTLDGMKIDPAEELESALQFAKSLKFVEDGRRAVLIRLEYKAAAVRAMRDETLLAQERRDEAMRYETEAAESSTTNSTPPRIGRQSTFESTKRIALAALEWKSDEPSAQEAGRARLLAFIRTAPSNLARDDLFLLLYTAENLLKSNELAADEAAALAEQIRHLIPVKSFPSADPSEPEAARRVQGVFARYLELAQTAGKE
jgi:hypothetical protein